MQQQNKLDQCPGPAEEAVFSFVSGCCFFVCVFGFWAWFSCALFCCGFFSFWVFLFCFGFFVCFIFFLNHLHVFVSTWHDADKRTSTGVEGSHPNGPPGNSLKSINTRTMLFLCCWIRTSAFFCALVSVWLPSDAVFGLITSLTQLLHVHHCLGHNTSASTMHC